MSLWTQVEAMLWLSAGRPLPEKLQNKLTTSSGIFGKLLKAQQTATAATTMPTPPVPPADTMDAAAQKQYQLDLQAYHTQFASYNSQMMARLMQQFQMMQQTMFRAQQMQAMQSRSAGSSASSAVETTSDIGGIL